MKTKWHECILWRVLSLGLLLCCAADTNQSPVTRGRSLFLKLETSQSKLATTESSPAAGGSSLTPVTSPRSMRSAESEAARVQSGFASLPDVSVTCSRSDFVVRVKAAFYGLGARAEELTLGSGCRSNGVLRPYGDFIFTYPLTACEAVRETPSGYLLYKTVLHYKPSATRFPSRAQPLDVAIECRYQRSHHVYRLAVKPTWKTAVMRKKLMGRPSDFKIELMDDSWSAPSKKPAYQLGQTVNIQVTALHLPPGGKLYISSCYTAPFSGSDLSLKYTIIDNLGCMLDSMKHPGASQFIHQTHKTLQFSLKAFQFTSDPDTGVSIHCKLSITSEDPSPAHKSCTYRANGWTAISGDDSICECCDSQCVTPKPRRVMQTGFASSDLLFVSDQPYTAGAGSSTVVMSGEDQNKAPRLRTDELNSQESLWKSTDVLKYGREEEEEPRLTTEPDVETLIFRHGVLVEERNESEEDSSGYDEEEEEEEGDDFLEGEDEEERSGGEEGEISARLHWAQSEQVKYEPLNSDEERKHSGRGEERKDDSLADVVDDEMTWYFTWR
ncbi:zona pellucida sperm-binding protein 3 [Solea solea]|uniref:zona pellucida sperm-binding protein 3 n=1 Tax=Solea solea TaxID=90069 RepID=UPI00272D3BD1|nr:zona pellucida sperm-binding protein 3 [Solea solea]